MNKPFIHLWKKIVSLVIVFEMVISTMPIQWVAAQSTPPVPSGSAVTEPPKKPDECPIGISTDDFNLLLLASAKKAVEKRQKDQSSTALQPFQDAVAAFPATINPLLDKLQKRKKTKQDALLEVKTASDDLEKNPVSATLLGKGSKDIRQQALEIAWKKVLDAQKLVDDTQKEIEGARAKSMENAVQNYLKVLQSLNGDPDQQKALQDALFIWIQTQPVELQAVIWNKLTSAFRQTLEGGLLNSPLKSVMEAIGAYVQNAPPAKKKKMMEAFGKITMAWIGNLSLTNLSDLKGKLPPDDRDVQALLDEVNTLSQNTLFTENFDLKAFQNRIGAAIEAFQQQYPDALARLDALWTVLDGREGTTETVAKYHQDLLKLIQDGKAFTIDDAITLLGRPNDYSAWYNALINEKAGGLQLGGPGAGDNSRWFSNMLSGSKSYLDLTVAEILLKRKNPEDRQKGRAILVNMLKDYILRGGQANEQEIADLHLDELMKKTFDEIFQKALAELGSEKSRRNIALGLATSDLSNEQRDALTEDQKTKKIEDYRATLAAQQSPADPDALDKIVQELVFVHAQDIANQAAQAAVNAKIVEVTLRTPIFGIDGNGQAITTPPGNPTEQQQNEIDAIKMLKNSFGMGDSIFNISDESEEWIKYITGLVLEEAPLLALSGGTATIAETGVKSGLKMLLGAAVKQGAKSVLSPVTRRILEQLVLKAVFSVAFDETNKILHAFLVRNGLRDWKNQDWSDRLEGWGKSFVTFAILGLAQAGYAKALGDKAAEFIKASSEAGDTLRAFKFDVLNYAGGFLTELAAMQLANALNALDPKVLRDPKAWLDMVTMIIALRVGGFLPHTSIIHGAAGVASTPQEPAPKSVAEAEASLRAVARQILIAEKADPNDPKLPGLRDRLFVLGFQKNKMITDRLNQMEADRTAYRAQRDIVDTLNGKIAAETDPAKQADLKKTLDQESATLKTLSDKVDATAAEYRGYREQRTVIKTQAEFDALVRQLAGEGTYDPTNKYAFVDLATGREYINGEAIAKKFTALEAEINGLSDQDLIDRAQKPGVAPEGAQKVNVAKSKSKADYDAAIADLRTTLIFAAKRDFLKGLSLHENGHRIELALDPETRADLAKFLGKDLSKPIQLTAFREQIADWLQGIGDVTKIDDYFRNLIRQQNPGADVEAELARIKKFDANKFNATFEATPGLAFQEGAVAVTAQPQSPEVTDLLKGIAERQKKGDLAAQALTDKVIQDRLSKLTKEADKIAFLNEVREFLDSPGFGDPSSITDPDARKELIRRQSVIKALIDQGKLDYGYIKAVLNDTSEAMVGSKTGATTFDSFKVYFSPDIILGKGQFGTVYKGFKYKTNPDGSLTITELAVKVFKSPTPAKPVVTKPPSDQSGTTPPPDDAATAVFNLPAQSAPAASPTPAASPAPIDPFADPLSGASRGINNELLVSRYLIELQDRFAQNGIPFPEGLVKIEGVSVQRAANEIDADGKVKLGKIIGGSIAQELMVQEQGNSIDLSKYHFASAEEAQQVVISLVEAVNNLHSLGFVINDIKPENIAVQRGADGSLHVVILDPGSWGLTGLPDEDASPQQIEQGIIPIRNEQDKITEYYVTPAGDTLSTERNLSDLTYLGSPKNARGEGLLLSSPVFRPFEHGSIEMGTYLGKPVTVINHTSNKPTNNGESYRVQTRGYFFGVGFDPYSLGITIKYMLRTLVVHSGLGPAGHVDRPNNFDQVLGEEFAVALDKIADKLMGLKRDPDGTITLDESKKQQEFLEKYMPLVPELLKLAKDEADLKKALHDQNAPAALEPWFRELMVSDPQKAAALRDAARGILNVEGDIGTQVEAAGIAPGTPRPDTSLDPIIEADAETITRVAGESPQPAPGFQADIPGLTPELQKTFEDGYSVLKKKNGTYQLYRDRKGTPKAGAVVDKNTFDIFEAWASRNLTVFSPSLSEGLKLHFEQALQKPLAEAVQDEQGILDQVIPHHKQVSKGSPDQKFVGYNPTPQTIADAKQYNQAFITSIIDDTGGSTAGVYRGKILYQGSVIDAAIKIYLDPIHEGQSERQVTIDYANKEKQISDRIESLGIAAKSYGRVNVEGNTAVAFEEVIGKVPEDFVQENPALFLAIVSENTIQQAKQFTQLLAQNDLGSGDLQFMILTQDQLINGKQRKKGEVIIIDVGSIRKLDRDAVTPDAVERSLRQDVQDARTKLESGNTGKKSSVGDAIVGFINQLDWSRFEQISASILSFETSGSAWWQLLTASLLTDPVDQKPVL